MNYARSTVRLAVTASLIALCSPAISQDPADQPFLVSADVQSKLVQLTRDYKPQAVLSNLASMAETTLNANASKPQTAEAYSNQVLQPNGLWASEFESKTSGTNTTGRSYTLSLCGLITVVTSGVAATGQDISTVLLAGKLFLPFGFRTTTGFTRTVRLNSLSTNESGVCTPSPGKEFSYRITSEITTKSAGLGSSAQTIVEEEDVFCKPATDEKPAAELFTQFRGKYLRVTCEHRRGQNPPAQREFIYLKDSGLYLMVALREAWGHSKVSYTAVQYAN